jgi:hypothetical protein
MEEDEDYTLYSICIFMPHFIEGLTDVSAAVEL